jgi:hypothetical protein
VRHCRAGTSQGWKAEIGDDPRDDDLHEVVAQEELSRRRA